MRTPGPPDPSARPVDVDRSPSLARLSVPGPLRARALEAAAASLNRDVGLCGDRCRAAAAHAIDAAVDAARRA